MTEIGFELLGDVKFHSESDLTNEKGEQMCNIGQMTFIWPRNSEPEIFDSLRQNIATSTLDAVKYVLQHRPEVKNSDLSIKQVLEIYKLLMMEQAAKIRD